MVKYERLDTAKFIRRAKRVHGNKYDYSQAVYINAKTKLIIICRTCGHKWSAIASNHFRGSGCKLCAYKKLPQNQRQCHDEFVSKARKIHGDKFTYISKYSTTKKKIRIKCNDCGYIVWQRASSHLYGSGCRRCQYQSLPQNQPFSALQFEEWCKKAHNDKYDYSGDYVGLKKKIRIFCRIHQEYFLQSPDAHLRLLQGCPKCHLSKGEQSIIKYLATNKIEYEYEKKFSDCKNKLSLSFDFYLPEYNICIEYDGEHHFMPLHFNGGYKRFEQVVENDKIKTEYCERKHIYLIRIPYWDYSNIDKILREEIGD